MSNITLASGLITNHDTLTVELVRPTGNPAVIMIKWPSAPSVLNPDPKALATLANAMVKTLAEAQATLASMKRRRR